MLEYFRNPLYGGLVEPFFKRRNRIELFWSVIDIGISLSASRSKKRVDDVLEVEYAGGNWAVELNQKLVQDRVDLSQLSLEKGLQDIALQLRECRSARAPEVLAFLFVEPRLAHPKDFLVELEMAASTVGECVPELHQRGRVIDLGVADALLDGVDQPSLYLEALVEVMSRRLGHAQHGLSVDLRNVSAYLAQGGAQLLAVLDAPHSRLACGGDSRVDRSAFQLCL